MGPVHGDPMGVFRKAIEAHPPPEVGKHMAWLVPDPGVHADLQPTIGFPGRAQAPRGCQCSCR